MSINIEKEYPITNSIKGNIRDNYPRKITKIKHGFNGGPIKLLTI